VDWLLFILNSVLEPNQLNRAAPGLLEVHRRVACGGSNDLRTERALALLALRTHRDGRFFMS
jgi:hypothetical protein